MTHTGTVPLCVPCAFGGTEGIDLMTMLKMR